MRLTPPLCPPELVPHLAALDPAPPPWRGAGRGARVWLVRHGSVSAGDVAYGDLDVQLSETGLAETQRASAELALLSPARVVASPLSRARRLGEAVAALAHAPLELDPRFREVHRGAWQGLPRDEYMRRWEAAREAYWRDPLGWKVPGGESEAELRARVVAALAERLHDPALAPGAVLVVAAHRQALRALVGAALGLPAAASHGFALDPACAALLVDEPDGWTLARSNVAHPSRPHAADPHDGPPGDVVARPRG